MTTILILREVDGGFKTDAVVNNANVTNDDGAPSFKYKADLIAGTEANETQNGVKIVAPLKYLGNFWRSLKIPLIKPFIKPSLRWIENYVLTTLRLVLTLMLLVQMVQLLI